MHVTVLVNLVVILIDFVAMLKKGAILMAAVTPTAMPMRSLGGDLATAGKRPTSACSRKLWAWTPQIRLV